MPSKKSCTLKILNYIGIGNTYCGKCIQWVIIMILCFNVIACACKINGSKDTNVLLMKIVNAKKAMVEINAVYEQMSILRH